MDVGAGVPTLVGFVIFTVVYAIAKVQHKFQSQKLIEGIALPDLSVLEYVVCTTLIRASKAREYKT